MKKKKDYTIPLLILLFLYACLVSCKQLEKNMDSNWKAKQAVKK